LITPATLTDYGNVLTAVAAFHPKLPSAFDPKGTLRPQVYCWHFVKLDTRLLQHESSAYATIRLVISDRRDCLFAPLHLSLRH
jgi:hypothetical protein